MRYSPARAYGEEEFGTSRPGRTSPTRDMGEEALVPSRPGRTSPTRDMGEEALVPSRPGRTSPTGDMGEEALATSQPGKTSSTDEPEYEAAITAYDQDNASIQDLGIQEPVSPKNEQVWSALTKMRLGKAKNLRQAAEGELAKTNVDLHEGKTNKEQFGNKMQSNLRKKIDTTHSIARSLWDRTTGTEDTIRHVGHSIFQLTRAQQATIGPSSVNSKCLELRKSRPLQEAVYDHFQKALEEEQAALQFTQKSYQERVEVSRGILQELEQAKALLHEDMLRKRHASRYAGQPEQPQPPRGNEGSDRPYSTQSDFGEDKAFEQEFQEAPACPAHGALPNANCKICQRLMAQMMVERSRENTKDEIPLPQMAEPKRGGVVAKTATTPRPQSAGKPGALAKLDPAQQLLANTYELCAAASRICARNEEVMRDRQKDCEVTRKMVVENMRKRLLETADLRKALEQEIRETNYAIGGMEDGVAETERQCLIHNVPLAGQLNKSMANRESQRGDGGKIRDVAPMGKEEGFSVNNANVRALQEQHKRKKTVLIQMTDVRAQLSDDLRCKVQAFNIDSQCSKLLTRPHSARLGGGPSPPPHRQGGGKAPFRRRGPNGNAANAGGMANTWGPGSNGW